MHLKVSSAKWLPFCPGGDELSQVTAAHLRLCTVNEIYGYLIFKWIAVTWQEWLRTRILAQQLPPNDMSYIHLHDVGATFTNTD